MKLQSKGQQLADILRDKIYQGIYSANAKIPSQRMLCKIYNVSRATVLAAETTLKAEGLLSGTPGSGLWVLPNKSHPAPAQIAENHRTVHVLLQDMFFQNSLFVQVLESLLSSYGNWLSVNLHVVHNLSQFVLQLNQDEIFLICGKFTDQDLEEFRDRYPKLLLLQWAREGFNYVALDEKKSGALAAKTLLENGHRQIGIIHYSSFMQDFYLRQEFTERLYGFNDCLAQHNIDPALEFKDVRWEMEELPHRLVNFFLHQPIKVTAILCPYDYIAAKVYQAFKQEQVRIPEDISLISFDNHYFSQYFSPGLSCIALPFANYAELIFEGINTLASGKSFTAKVLPYTINRQSIANLNQQE